VGIFQPDSELKIKILTNELGKTTTPSSVAFLEDGNVVVGEHAKTYDNYVYDAKRYIGRSFADAQTQELIRDAKFSVVVGSRGGCEVELGDGPANRHTMEEISAKILNAMKNIAEQHVG